MQIIRPLTIVILLSVLFFFDAYAQKIKKGDLIGTWHLSKDEINYPTITFKEVRVNLTSRGDTFYVYEYHLQGENLIFVDILGNKFKNHITFLNRDSLIFETLLQNKSIQVYTKTNRQ